MPTCPQCGGEIAEGATSCSECGYQISQETEKTKVMPSKTPPSGEPPSGSQPSAKPFYKRGGVIATIVVVALLMISCCLAVSAWFVLRGCDSSGYEKQVKGIWKEVVDGSKEFRDVLDKTSTQDDLGRLSLANMELIDLLKEKQDEVKKLEPLSKYEDSQDNLETFLENYLSYLTAAQKIIDNPLEVSLADDFANLEQLSSDAKSTEEDFRGSAVFIEEEVPGEIFDMPDVLWNLVKKIQAEKAAKEKAGREEQLKRQREADDDAVESTVVSFMQARIDQKPALMREYLTPKANREFDPAMEFQGDFDAVDFKITSLDRNSSSSYNVYGTEYDRDWEGVSFTTKWQFDVVKLGGRWLIDDRRTL